MWSNFFLRAKWLREQLVAASFRSAKLLWQVMVTFWGPVRVWVRRFVGILSSLIQRGPEPATKLTIKGRVQDIKDHPVVHAKVRLLRPPQSSRSNVNGNFWLDIPPPAKRKKLFLFAHGPGKIGFRFITVEPNHLAMQSQLDIDEIVLLPMDWKTWLGLIVGLVAYLVLFVVSLRPKFVVMSLVGLALVLWLLLDLNALPWPRVQDLFTQNNLHLIRKDLNAVCEISHLPKVVRSYQKITVVQSPDKKPIEVHEPCTVHNGGELIIQGPLTLLMNKGCGITSQGKLRIKGGQDGKARITFKRLNEKEPWANIEIVGEGANGSEIDNCAIHGGAGVLYNIPDMNISEVENRYQQQPLKRIGFSGNEAASVRVGGAVLASEVKQVTFTNCEFANNSSRTGGALALYSVEDLKVVNCNFAGNVAIGRRMSPGGAVYFANSQITFRDCEFENNRAQDKYSCGGAVYAGFHSNVQFKYCTFKGNAAGNVGGGNLRYFSPSYLQRARKGHFVESGNSYCQHDRV